MPKSSEKSNFDNESLHPQVNNIELTVEVTTPSDRLKAIDTISEVILFNSGSWANMLKEHPEVLQVHLGLKREAEAKGVPYRTYLENLHSESIEAVSMPKESNLSVSENTTSIVKAVESGSLEKKELVTTQDYLDKSNQLTRALASKIQEHQTVESINLGESDPVLEKYKNAQKNLESAVKVYAQVGRNLDTTIEINQRRSEDFQKARSKFFGLGKFFGEEKRKQVEDGGRQTLLKYDETKKIYLFQLKNAILDAENALK